MARALRPVVILMLLASGLFVAAGVLDGVYPGGESWSATLPAVSYVFAVVNTFVAILVARGSERSLALRMGLSIFFVIERPASAFVLGAKTAPSIGVHLATALVELVILVSAIRVWRLGHSVPSGELDQLLSLDAASASTPASEPEAAPRRGPVKLRPRSAWLIGITTLLLAALLVADGVMSGFVPGGRQWGVSGASGGWLVYVCALVALVVATRAVQGGRFALRLLTLLALIAFVERALSPFASRAFDPVALGMHALAALAALAVALACAGALRGTRAKHGGDVASLEAA